MLLVISGLPGTGKSTIAKAFAGKYSAVYLRIDEIENAIRNNSPSVDIGPLGYVVAFSIARSNLTLGNLVVADSVNPVLESRQGWHEAANTAGSSAFDVEITCSDKIEHRRRVETRPGEIVGHRHPTWERVESLQYAAWTTARLVVDTALLSPDEAVVEIAKHLGLMP